MKKQKHRIFVVLLVISMIMTTIPVGVFAASTESYSGTCGDNLTWNLDTYTGAMTISGTGDMTSAPWNSYKSNIQTITIQNGLNSIMASAFSNCSNLTSITIPNSVTTIGTNAFLCCKQLSNIVLPENLINLGYECLYETAIKSIDIPDTAICIEDYTFYNCHNLSAVKLGKNINRIGVESFYATAIKTIEIPSKVTSIDDGAFRYCSSLTSIVIPQSVKSIKYAAFLGCNSLKDVYFQGSQEDWNKISFGSSNSSLKNATIHYNYFIESDETSFSDLSPCIPQDAVEFQGHYYKFFTDKMKWHDAKKYCEDLGGYLVTITSAEENQFISSLIGGDIIIGATDEAQEGVWQWVTGELFEYSNFPLGEPNNQGNEDYLCMGKSGFWNDGHCEREYWAFVCEWDTVPNNISSLVFDGDYGVFGLDIDWSLSLFDEDNCTFNDNLAKAAICLSQDIYNPQNVLDRLEDLGFSSIGYTENLFSGEDWAKYGSPPIAFGSASYKSKEGITKTVVSVTVQGTTDVATAITDVVDGGLQGFSKVGEIALSELKEFASIHSIDLTSEDTIFFITGHSLGGATAGRLMLELKKMGIKGKSFVYTFASAMYDTMNYRGEDFPYVFNLINIGDVVPTVPPWSTRVGVDITFNSVFYLEEQSKIIHKDKNQILYDYYSKEKLRQAKVNPFKLTSISLERLRHYHNLSTYLPYIISGNKSYSQIDAEYDFDLLLYSIKCPVDIVLYDGTGKKLSYTESDKVTNCEESPIFVMVNDEDKYVLAPSYYPLDIEIIGTGEGTMDYSVQKLAADEIALEEVCFENVAIEPGKMMLSEVGDENKSIDETKLYITESGEKTAKISNDGTEIARDTSGIYDGIEYTLYNDGELRFDGDGTLHFYETEDNPMLIYGDRITSVVLGRNVACEHCYDLDNKVVEEIENAAESIYYVCKMCFGKKQLFDGSKVPQFLQFSGAALTLQNNLKINFVAKKELFEEYGCENPYATIEMNGNEVTVSDYTVNGEYYVFSFNNIAPNMMNDTITATLHATYHGVEYSGTELEYSIAQYCYSMIGRETTSDKLRTLLVDLLNYGAASQIYTAYHTDDLVNSDLTDDQKDWGTAADPALTSVTNARYRTVDSPDVTWAGVSLNLNDSITMQFVFTTASTEGVTVKVKNRNGTLLKEISAEEFVTSGGYYIAKFKGLTAGQMSDTVYVTAYRGDEAISNTVAYSIESYAYAKQNDSNENLANLVKAMMKYGNSAYTYVH